MKYRVLKPIGWSGRREPGEILEMKEEDAKNIGLEYLEKVEDKAAVTEPKNSDEITGEYKKDEPSAPKNGVPESEPATAGEKKVEDKAAVKSRGGRGKNNK